MTAAKETVSQEIAETEMVKKLQKLKTLYEKKLISVDDFKAKKADYLAKYSAGDTTRECNRGGA